jgi:release factor glutamine methyltransferase
VEAVTGLTATEWMTGLDRDATVQAMSRFDEMVARRREGEPLQYVLGSWGFRRLDLFLDERVLIPRPETETVAQQAIDAARSALVARAGPVRIVDLGTGSGAIGLSLAAEIDDVRLEIWATDQSADALAVCLANLAGVGVGASRVRVEVGDWFEALPARIEGCLDVVVSNPPYVHDGHELPPEVHGWEPAEALRAGPRGMDAYERIVPDARRWLRPGGVLVLEISPLLATAVSELARQEGFEDVLVHPDLTHRLRIVTARRPQER